MYIINNLRVLVAIEATQEKEYDKKSFYVLFYNVFTSVLIY